MATLTVAPRGPLRGRLGVPGDKSISHRAVLLAALGEGTSRLRGLSGGEDVGATLGAVAALGAGVTPGDQADPVGGRRGARSVRIEGGRRRLHEPEAVLEVGNSGTALRLLAGAVAGLPGLTVLQGDASVARRPMDRVATPLRAMGAGMDGRAAGRLPPLVVRGGDLSGIDHTPPVASAQVKGAILLAGLAAAGETVIREPVATRAHTEELLTRCGAHVRVTPAGAGQAVAVRAGSLEPLDLEVPGDPSQAAFWVVAACLVPGSEVRVDQVYVGPGRAGFLDVLARMGAEVEVHHREATTADLLARYGPLRGTEVAPEEVPALVDEVPVLAVAAALAEGATRFRGVGELRVKESDRLAAIQDLLGAVGGRVEVVGDDLVVTGAGALHGDRVASRGDHRIAMAGAVAGLVATGATTVEGWEGVATSYPGFEEDLAGLWPGGGPG